MRHESDNDTGVALLQFARISGATPSSKSRSARRWLGFDGDGGLAFDV